MQRSLQKLLKQLKSAWMAPAVMLLALAIPNSLLFFKFLTVIWALCLFYSAILSSKHYLGGSLK